MRSESVKGTFDYLPAEAELREYLERTILEVYQSHGFERIITPIIEDSENLTKSEGGDNLNLIFKIMKRGDKLKSAIESGNFEELADMGLRYDLTLPLSRYYANNRAKLMNPMKCIQIDRVYRAERPQKGRNREFTQCDIDILGASGVSSELELIETTAEALLAVGMKNFKVKVNDRRLLHMILKQLGFMAEQLDTVCISFDKLDKIGVEGVATELADKAIDASVIKAFTDFLAQPINLEAIGKLVQDDDVLSRMQRLLQEATIIAQGRYEVVFDISLVRGQGYYTGTVFEIESKDYRGAIAGGGRYDNLIGKFTNETIPAVGFSIGFERIYSILKENGYQFAKPKRIAVLFAEEEYIEATKLASELRKEYRVTLYEKGKKVSKFINRLEENHFDGFVIVGSEKGITMFNEEKQG